MKPDFKPQYQYIWIQRHSSPQVSMTKWNTAIASVLLSHKDYSKAHMTASNFHRLIYVADRKGARRRTWDADCAAIIVPIYDGSEPWNKDFRLSKEGSASFASKIPTKMLPTLSQYTSSKGCSLDVCWGYCRSKNTTSNRGAALSPKLRAKWELRAV